MCDRCVQNPAELLKNKRYQKVDFGDLGEVRKLLCQDRRYADDEVRRIRDLLLTVADDFHEVWRGRRRGHGGAKPPSPTCESLGVG